MNQSRPQRIAIVGGNPRACALADLCAAAGQHVGVLSRRESIETEVERIEPDWVEGADLVWIATSERFGGTAVDLVARHFGPQHDVVHSVRALIDDEMATFSATLMRQSAALKIGCVAGPINATSLRAQEPGAVVVGSAFPEVIDRVRAAIGGPGLRVYAQPELEAVELSLTLSSLLEIAVGFAHGTGLGPEVCATLATRGLSEVARVATAAGHDRSVVHGLACAGAVAAALAGAPSSFVRLGQALASGEALEGAAIRVHADFDALSISGRVLSFADRTRLELPICQTIGRVLQGDLDGEGARRFLMNRPVGLESVQ